MTAKMDQRSRNRSVSLSSDEALNGPLRGSGTSRAGGSSTTNVGDSGINSAERRSLAALVKWWQTSSVAHADMAKWRRRRIETLRFLTFPKNNLGH
ncbi:hypothetical protein V6Z11_A11G025100 [Gossypium hirsutum]